jgi:hypothetical protein
MELLQIFELASYLVTVVGLPFAIVVYLRAERRERENEEAAVYQTLSDDYTEFMKLVLENPDLRLRSAHATPDLTAEQRERQLVIFDLLVSVFERAYILLYEPAMSANRARRWRSWEDWMREWCGREDFRTVLPTLLRGEDPDFIAYIQRIASEEGGAGIAQP